MEKKPLLKYFTEITFDLFTDINHIWLNNILNLILSWESICLTPPSLLV